MENKIKKFLQTKIQKIKEVRKEIEEDEIQDMALMDEEEPVKVQPLRHIWSMEGEGGGFLEKLKNHRKMLRNRWVILGILAAVLALSGGLFLNFHLSDSYSVISSEKRNDINGTQYQKFGKNLLKYSSDGISCLNRKGEVLWSSTFSIQSPLLDLCGTIASVAEKDGTQVYLFDSEGQVGQFNTLLPIEKVCVAEQGVVAVVLEDGNNTWINLYDAGGELIAENKTSVEESGYPLDIALSPDGRKLMVSFLNPTGGSVQSNVVFYNFDSVGKANANNLVNTVSYENTAIPEVYFVSDKISVAVRGNGFSVFKGNEVPEESADVSFEEEIQSVFYDDEHIGFVFKSDKKEHKYLLRMYSLGGRRTAQKYFDFAYKEIRMDDDKILMFQDAAMAVFSTSGRRRAEVKYRKPIEDVISLGGFRKYLVLTQESTDRIRLR